ncbi:MAG: hypothetical protein A4E27_00692 [Methanobacterium sp. PtaU1.Bin242]|nr:MAG: hypothetical protein A4E27_00692 [Methanobacterium sp. PtaU1.Bin242]
MKIVTTPMCQEILHLAGVSKFQLSNSGFYGNADIVILLSETKTHNNSGIKFIKLKLNTFSQINKSINMVSDLLGTEPLNEPEDRQVIASLEEFYHGRGPENRKIKVKVYSNFLEEIVKDMGFTVVAGNNYDFMVYPDYMKEKLKEEIAFAGERAIELPSHKNTPLNPIKRAKMRYQILENSLCMKH